MSTKARARAAKANKNQKIVRHSQYDIITPPIMGANKGATTMAMVIYDMARAASLPSQISRTMARPAAGDTAAESPCNKRDIWEGNEAARSEEHTSEHQSRGHVVFRLP